MDFVQVWRLLITGLVNAHASGADPCYAAVTLCNPPQMAISSFLLETLLLAIRTYCIVSLLSEMISRADFSFI